MFRCENKSRTHTHLQVSIRWGDVGRGLVTMSDRGTSSIATTVPLERDHATTPVESMREAWTPGTKRSFVSVVVLSQYVSCRLRYILDDLDDNGVSHACEVESRLRISSPSRNLVGDDLLFSCDLGILGLFVFDCTFHTCQNALFQPCVEPWRALRTGDGSTR